MIHVGPVQFTESLYGSASEAVLDHPVSNSKAVTSWRKPFVGPLLRSPGCMKEHRVVPGHKEQPFCLASKMACGTEPTESGFQPTVILQQQGVLE